MEDRGYLRNADHDIKFDYKREANGPHLYAHEIEDLRTLQKPKLVYHLSIRRMSASAFSKAVGVFHEHGRKKIHDPEVYQAYAHRIANCELRQHQRGGHLRFRPDCTGCRTASAR